MLHKVNEFYDLTTMPRTQSVVRVLWNEGEKVPCVINNNWEHGQVVYKVNYKSIPSANNSIFMLGTEDSVSRCGKSRNIAIQFEADTPTVIDSFKKLNLPFSVIFRDYEDQVVWTMVISLTETLSKSEMRSLTLDVIESYLEALIGCGASTSFDGNSGRVKDVNKYAYFVGAWYPAFFDKSELNKGDFHGYQGSGNGIYCIRSRISLEKLQKSLLHVPCLLEMNEENLLN
jgi:hypothetical protein